MRQLSPLILSDNARACANNQDVLQATQTSLVDWYLTSLASWCTRLLQQAQAGSAQGWQAFFLCFPKVLCCLLGFCYLQCAFHHFPDKSKALHALKAACSCSFSHATFCFDTLCRYAGKLVTQVSLCGALTCFTQNTCRENVCCHLDKF